MSKTSIMSRARLLAVSLLILTTIFLFSNAAVGQLEEPSSVTIAGSMQSELGCPGDWQPDCTATQLATAIGM
jgi:hypothetical protein